MNGGLENITKNKDVKRKIISDEDLSTAAKFAFLEAGSWVRAIKQLDISNQNFDSQICVLAMFAIELYLKTILMKKGKHKTGHKQRMATDIT